MVTPSRARRPERGAALILALLVLTLTLTAGLLAAVALALDQRAHRDDVRRARLGALADSALAEALAELARDPWSAGIADHSFAEGLIGCDILGSGPDRRRIEARARYAGFVRSVVAEVELTRAGPRMISWLPGGTTPAGP